MVMAVPLPRATMTTPASSQVSSQIRDKAGVLANLADAISTQWDKMEHHARRAMVRKIQLLALDLGRVAEGTDSKPGTVDSEAGSPWFEGLIFLTPREYEVLRALSLGASTRRIGELFGISTATVRSHVKSLLAKLGVHSRVEAVSLLLLWDTRQQQPA